MTADDELQTIPEQMLAGVYRGHRRVEVERVPVPHPDPGEALISVAACGVCGTDLKKIEYGLQDPPRIYGHEIAGRIVALGEGVTPWKVGDRVVVHHHVPCGSCYYCDRRAYAHCPTYRRTGTTAGFAPAGGGFAQFVLVSDWIVERGIVRIPDDVSYAAASMVEPLNTCLKGFKTARAGGHAGETVLILGAGPIGLLFLQLASLDGLRVLASDPRPERRAAALSFGAEAVFDPMSADLPASVRDVTAGRGADLAIVAVASTAVATAAMEALRPAGRMLLFAQTRMGDPIALDAGQICALEKSVIGSYSADIELQQPAADLIFSGAVQAEALITHRFPLTAIEQALTVAANPIGGSMKVVVEP